MRTPLRQIEWLRLLIYRQQALPFSELAERSRALESIHRMLSGRPGDLVRQSKVCLAFNIRPIQHSYDRDTNTFFFFQQRSTIRVLRHSSLFPPIQHVSKQETIA